MVRGRIGNIVCVVRYFFHGLRMNRCFRCVLIAVVMLGAVQGCGRGEPGEVKDVGGADVALVDSGDSGDLGDLGDLGDSGDLGDLGGVDVESDDSGVADADAGVEVDVEVDAEPDDVGEGDTGGPVLDVNRRPSVSRYGMSMGWDALQWLSAADLERTMDALKDLGVGVLRTDLSWDSIQPDGPDTYKWEKFDQVVDMAKVRGIQMMPILHRSPNWARPPGTKRNEHPDLDAFREFARVAAERYQSRGIYYWMVWNEPNHKMFFSPADPVAYAALLNAGYEGVKAGNPQAFVVSAGLSPVPATDLEEGRYVSAVEFARAMYQHQPKLDAFGFHPYGWPLPPTSPEGWQGWRMIESNGDNLRAIMTEHGDGAKRIWLSEYGAPTSVVSEADQADFLQSAYELAGASEWAGPLFYYSFRDIGTDVSEPEHFYGLLRNDWSQKPGYARYKNMPRLPDVRK